MSKFNLGDKVRIRSDIDLKEYIDPIFVIAKNVNNIYDLAGRTGIVERIENYGMDDLCCIRFDDGFAWVLEKALELIKSAKEASND